MSLRTSNSHPLRIAEIPLPAGGMIGISFCPGKTQQSAMSGAWDRDLGIDLDVIRDWGAAVVVTLVEEWELEALGVPDLGAQVTDRHMYWHHLPIRDVSVPDAVFEQAWGHAGPDLVHRLHHGFRVFVHCKGGLGRAGMIAARLMVEMGEDPAAAIRTLRSVRPGAIETTAQEAHVHAASRRRPPLPDTGPDAIRDRALGALLGLAAGDALGTTLEFSRRDRRPRLTDIIGGGPFTLAPGQWTDDTAMALALADSLTAHPLLDEADLMARFARWEGEGLYSCTGTCFDIGVTTAQAIARYRQTGDPIAGATDPRSAGNGSLMRLAPVAIRYWRDRSRLIDAAARQSRVTHGAPEAVEACILFAQMLADAIAGKPAQEVLRERQSDLPGIAAITMGGWRGMHRHEIRSSGYVLHSLEAALWATGRSGTLAEALLLAANLGDDADTTAAITGQLAGALHGSSALPEQWRDRIAWAPRITGMVDALLE